MTRRSRKSGPPGKKRGGRSNKPLSVIDLAKELGELDQDGRAILNDLGLETCLNQLMDHRASNDKIGRDLSYIDAIHDREIETQKAEFESEFGTNVGLGPPLDLAAAISALVVIQQYLSDWGIQSIALDRLQLALTSTFHGRPPAMLQGPSIDHRAPEPPNIQAIKGMLGAAMYVYQKKYGLTKQVAAKSVLKNIAKDLKIRFSRKPISMGMILSWRHQFGGSGARPGPGRESYQKWVKAFTSNPESHDKYILLLTDDLARSLASI